MTEIEPKKFSREQLRRDMQEIFKRTKEEFESHLDSINENTTEIQANFEYIQRLEVKIDKVNERLDTMHMMFKKLVDIDNHIIDEDSVIKPLTEQEKRVFLILYTANSQITYDDIVKKLSLPVGLAREYITSMIEKGLPINKQYLGGIANFKLDNLFKEKQAKENLLGISQKTLDV